MFYNYHKFTYVEIFRWLRPRPSRKFTEISEEIKLNPEETTVKNFSEDIL